jgi:hypothetical protein
VDWIFVRSDVYLCGGCVDDFISGVDGIAAPDFLDGREDDGRSEFETVFYVDIAFFRVVSIWCCTMQDVWDLRG